MSDAIGVVAKVETNRKEGSSRRWALAFFVAAMIATGALIGSRVESSGSVARLDDPEELRVEAMLAKLRFGRMMDNEQVSEILRDACERGELVACPLSKYDGPIDPKMAATFSQLACDRDDALGCFGLSLYYAHASGDEIPDKNDATNAAAGLEAAKKGCELGLARACAEYAWYFDEAVGVPEDNKKSRQILEKHCVEGHHFSCASLATHYASGEGGRRDRAEAERLAKVACNAGESYGCTVVTGMLLGGFKGTKQDLLNADEEQAVAFAEKGCQLGGVRSCEDIALLFHLKSGSESPSANETEHIQKAARYSERTCKHGSAWGCTLNAMIKADRPTLFEQER